MADVTITKIAGYVRVRILMNRSFFSNFWDSYFSSYGEFGEFSLTFTAAMNGRSAVAVCQRKRLITFNVAVVDFGPAWHC